MNGKTRLPCHWNYFYFKVIYRLVLRNFIIFAAYLSVSVHFSHKPWEKAKSYLGEMNKSPWGFKRDYFSYSKTKKSHFLSTFLYKLPVMAYFIRRTRTRAWTFEKSGRRTFEESGHDSKIKWLSQKVIFGQL